MVINQRHYYLSAGLPINFPTHYYEPDENSEDTFGADLDLDSGSYDEPSNNDDFTFIPKSQSLSDDDALTAFEDYSLSSSPSSTPSLSTPFTQFTQENTAYYTTLPTTSALLSISTLSNSKSHVDIAPKVSLSSSSIVIPTKSPTSSLADITRAATSHIPSSSITTSASTSSSVAATLTNSNMSSKSPSSTPVPRSSNDTSSSSSNNTDDGGFISRFFNNLPHSPVSIIVLIIILACILIITIAITTFFLRRMEKRRKKEKMTLDMFRRPLGGYEDEERHYGSNEVDDESVDEDGWTTRENAVIRNSSSLSPLIDPTDFEQTEMDPNMATIPRPEPVMQPSHLHIEYSTHGQAWRPTAYTYATPEEYAQHYHMNTTWSHPYISQPQVMDPVWHGNDNGSAAVASAQLHSQEQWNNRCTGTGVVTRTTEKPRRVTSSASMNHKSSLSQFSEPFFSQDIFSRADDRYTAAWVHHRKRCPTISENAVVNTENGNSNTKEVKFVDTWLCDVPETLSKKGNSIRKPQPLSTRYHTSQAALSLGHGRYHSLDSGLTERYQKLHLQTSHHSLKRQPTLSETTSSAESLLTAKESSSSLSKSQPHSPSESLVAMPVLSVRNKTSTPSINFGCAGPRPLPGSLPNDNQHLFAGTLKRTHSVATTAVSEYSQRTALSEKTMVARDLLLHRARKGEIGT